ncbi:MAG: MBL fold metallo-hydrolase [Actinobacteria bacterium]|nr:MBL fold metallo-hydrolase [Actinomycetota bacterium]
MLEGWPFGDYPEGGLERLSPHVTAYHGSAYPVSNSAIVRGADATLVFDANVLRYARELRAAVDDEPGPPLRDLVLSHAHDDHTIGAMHFVPPARALARSYTRERLSAWTAYEPGVFVEEMRGYYPGAAEEATGIRVVVPDVVVKEAETLDLGGGVRLRLFPEPEAHTKGDLWAFVEPDGVALCGDLWFNECEPYLGSGSVTGALAAIARLRSAEARVYLPGHGRAGAMAADGRDPVERYSAWLLEEVGAGVAVGLDGEDLKAAVRASYDGQDGVGFPLSIPGFLEDSVEAAVRDVRGV